MRLHVLASIAVACSAQVPVPVAGGAGIFQLAALPKLSCNHDFVLTLDQKESASVDNLEGAKVTLKKDADLQTQLWFKEDGKIRYARNPDFVLDHETLGKGTSIILSKDKQDQSQRWSIYF